MIEIQQAIWGYSSGHHLLASSVSLSSQSLKVLEPLTDLSGSDIIKSFDGYLTGCYLPAEKYYAVSKTWYAPEMPRQGCVWTHTLLIKDSFVPNSNGLKIEELFLKPDIYDTAWKEQYIKPIVVQSQNSNHIGNKDFRVSAAAYRMLSILAQHSEPIIVSASNSEAANQMIELLIEELGMDFFQDITFCTGSFSNRKINRVQLDLQIVPESISKQVFRTSQEGTFFSSNPLNFTSNNDYVECFNAQERYKEVKNFISFCDRKYYNRTYWTIFEKLFCSIKEIDSFSVENVKIILQYNLTEDEISAIMLKVFEFIFCRDQKLINNDSKTMDSILFDFFTSKCFVIHDNTGLLFIQDSLNYLWNHQHQQIMDQIPQLFNSELNEAGECALNYISSLVTLDDFTQLLQKNTNMCLSMLHSNYRLALCADLWKQTQSYQNEVLRELRNSPIGLAHDESLCSDVLTLIFSVGTYGLSIELYKTFKDDSINGFIDYFESSNCNYTNIKKWSPLCAMNQRLSLSRLESVTVPELFEAIISVLDPYEIDTGDISPTVLEKYYKKFCFSNSCQSVKSEFAQFALPIILRSNYEFSKSFLQFVFLTVHKLLANDKMEYAKWENLSRILPEVAWYNSWDKCKRLRKASKQKKYDIDFGIIFNEDKQ